MKIDILKPYGFCKGVSLVLDKLEDIVRNNSNKDIYCINNIVHNTSVMEQVKRLGIKVLIGNKEDIVSNLSNSVIILSAHGTSKKILDLAKTNNNIVYDLVCPFVKSEFQTMEKLIKEDYFIIYVGVNNHDEAVAATSISTNILLVESVNDVKNLPSINSKIAVVTQSTISCSTLSDIYYAIKEKYQDVKLVDEICNETRLRQDKLEEIADSYDTIIVVGDKSSNNSNELYKKACKSCKNVAFVSSYDELESDFLNNMNKVLVCSGTSTSNDDVDKLVDIIKKQQKI